MNRFFYSLRRLIGILFCSLVGVNMQADPLPEHISFQHLLDNKDISIGEIPAFFQDSKGFMWIGGSGVLRFDGYEFKSIEQTVQGKLGIEKKPLTTTINSFFEDSEKNIWLLARTGLFRYDPRTELMRAVPDDPSSSARLSVLKFSRAIEISNDELLIGSSAGLIICNKRTNIYTVIASDAAKKDWLQGNDITSIYSAEKGVYWLGTNQGLERVEWDAKKFTLFKPHATRPELVPSNIVTAIVSDNNNGLWIGTKDGLVHFDIATQASTRYVHDLSDVNSISSNDISSLLLDVSGALWVGSDGGGISIFEKSARFPQGHFTNHKYEAGRSASISSSQVRTVYEDHIGDIWVGNYPTGINYFDRSSTAIITLTHDVSDPNSLSHNSVLFIKEDEKHNLWLGTDGGGLDYYNRADNKFTHYKNDPLNSKTLSANAVLSLFVDSENIIWAGTWGGGISKLNPDTGEFERMPFDILSPKTGSVTHSQRLNNAHVWSIKEDRQKDLWICTFQGGLSKYDRKTKTYTHYQSMENEPTSIVPGIIWDTLEDAKGNFWVAADIGLDLMDRKTETFTHFTANPNVPHSLTNGKVISIFEDSKQRLWLGTESGLNLLNPDGKTFTGYTKANGLNNDYIKKIVEDAEGRLWLSTNNGVSLFDPETKKIKNYSRVSGRLLGSFYTNSGVMTSAGEIIFGGIDGLRIFNYKQLKDNQAVPPIVFTNMKIFTDVVNVGDPDGLLPQSLNYTKTLTLDYQKSMFQFGFSALNFRDTNKNSYAYKLDGFDKNWMQVGDQRSAKYTNLNAGTYNFHVKGSNNDGIWNDEGVSITIVQLPPPWKTWWAYTLYALAFIAVVILFIHSQRKKRRLVEEQNRLLEIKVFERTAELREKNSDIQSMLSNMRQGLFTIEASGNIHPEYSRFLEEIFETNHIAGHNAPELLFGRANLGSNTFDQIKEAISAIIGEDEMNFAFNSHLLIEEYESDFDGKSKFLSLDWNPVIANNMVCKLMVSVRDVTLLKKMEHDALSKKRELDIISQLLNVSAKKYLVFALSAKRFISENRMEVERNEHSSETIIALLFRNMHTLKGNCRTFNFSYFSDVVHEVESTYSELQHDLKTNWNRDKLLSDLLCVENILQEYERVYYTVLGRGESSGGARDKNGCWADSKTIESIQRSIDSSTEQFPALRDSKLFLPIQLWLNRATSSPLSETLADIIDSLPSIARQLNKEVPTIVIEDNHVRIKSSGTELITNVFAHILRNSVDHGIETPESTLHTEKPHVGKIEIRAIPHLKCLHIHIKDDGLGLNIDKLFQAGIDLGKWKANDKPNYSDVANLIFISGVSTKEQVTSISGRGVGMAAVKDFLLEQGGNISLELLSPHAQSNSVGNGVMVPFELIVTLPENIFTTTAGIAEV